MKKKFGPKSALLAARAAESEDRDRALDQDTAQTGAGEVDRMGKAKLEAKANASKASQPRTYPMGLSELDVMVALTFVALAVCTPLSYYAGNRVIALKTERSRVPQFVTADLKAHWENVSVLDQHVYKYDDMLGNMTFIESTFAGAMMHNTKFVVHKYRAVRSLVETSVRNTSIVGMGLSSKLELARSSLHKVSLESISVLQGFRSTRSHFQDVVVKNPVVYDAPIVSQSVWCQSTHQGAVMMKKLRALTNLFYGLVFEEALDLENVLVSDSVLRRMIIRGAFKVAKGRLSSSLVGNSEFSDVHLTGVRVDATHVINASVSGLATLSDVTVKGSRLQGASFFSDFAAQGLTLKSSVVEWLTVRGTSLLQGLYVSSTQLSDIVVEGNSLIRDVSVSGVSASSIRFGLSVSFAGFKVKGSSFENMVFAKGASFSKLSIKSVSISSTESFGNFLMQDSHIFALKLNSFVAYDNVNLSRSYVDQSEFSRSVLHGGIDLKGSTWSKSMLTDTTLGGDLNARNAMWSGVTLQNIKSMSSGSTAEFSGASLRKSLFVNSSFAHEFNFARANLRAVVFEGVYFRDDVDFEDAVLQSVVFRNVTFGSHAKFDSAKLKSCLFENCVFQTKVKARHVDVSKDTKFVDCTFPGSSTFTSYTY